MKKHVLATFLLLLMVSPTAFSHGQVIIRQIQEEIRNQILQKQNGFDYDVKPLFVGPPVIAKPPQTQPPQTQTSQILTPTYGAPNQTKTYAVTTDGVRSRATFNGTTLTIFTDGVGYNYRRRPEFDSRDGEFLGFSNQTLTKTIRFPVNGGNRMQIAGPRNNWLWSETTVETAPTEITFVDLHAQIDRLAFKIQDQSRQLARVANQHYRHSPHYGHLIADTSAMLKQSMHLHDVAYEHGDLQRLAEDLAKLDTSFHHLEETFTVIAGDAAAQRSHVKRHTARVKELLSVTEENLHLLQDIITSVSTPVPPTATGVPFGTFCNIELLTQQLEQAANDLLLDLHFNYSHNSQFAVTYREVYCILDAAQTVRTAAKSNRKGKIVRTLKGLDSLAHRLESDIRNWTCKRSYRCGNGSHLEKLSTVQWVLADLMHDVGIAPTKLNFAGQHSSLPPLKIAPPPR